MLFRALCCLCSNRQSLSNLNQDGYYYYQDDALGDKDLSFTNESSFQDRSIDMNVNCIWVGGSPTNQIPSVHVDGVQMEHHHS